MIKDKIGKKSLIKKINFLTIIFSLLGIFSLSILIDRIDDITIVYTVLILIFLGFVFLGKKINFQIFLLSFLIALSFLPLYTYSYLIDTSFPFIPGGDSQTFYEKVVDISNGDTTSLWGRYIGFLYLVSSFYKLITFFGISTSPYHFFLFSAFCGSLSSVLVFLIGKKSFNLSVAIKASLLTMFFPILLKYSLGSLREIVALPMLLLGIYTILLENKKSKMFTLITIAFLSIIRLDWAIVLIIFAFFYYTAGLPIKVRGKIYFRVFILTLIFSSLAFFLVNNGYFDISYYQGDKINEITSKTLEESNSGSLSSKLIKLGLLGRFFLFFYVIFVPIPPPIVDVKVSEIEPLLTSIGAVFWYFCVFYLFFVLKKTLRIKKYKKITIASIMMICANLLVLSFTSIGTYRHKLFIYPIAFLFLASFNQFYSRKFGRLLFFVITMVIITLFSSYLIFKS